MIGFFEIPITTVKPTHCRSIDLKTLIRLVVQNYHPGKTEPITVHY